MPRAVSFIGVVLATGEDSSLSRDKALLPWNGRTCLEAHLEALQPHTDFVLVVAGKNSECLEPVVDASGASLVVNRRPECGQLVSLQVGLQEVLNRGRDAAIVALVDRPPAKAETVLRLRQVFEQAPRGIWCVIPECEGQRGYPIVIGREMITVFLRAAPESDPIEIERANLSHIAHLNVDDPFTLNLEDPEECKRIGP